MGDSNRVAAQERGSTLDVLQRACVNRLRSDTAVRQHALRQRWDMLSGSDRERSHFGAITIACFPHR